MLKHSPHRTNHQIIKPRNKHHQHKPRNTHRTSYKHFFTTIAPKDSSTPTTYTPENTKYLPHTHRKFAHRPKVITLDVTGTLLTPQRSIAELYQESAAKVGIFVDNLDNLQEAFYQAFHECKDLYPFFGNGTLPSSKNWWFQVVKRTFVHAGLNLPYSQQDFLFDQIYSDFAQSSHYHVFADVVPFLNFIQDYNTFVSKYKTELYQQQRQDLHNCLHVAETTNASESESSITTTSSITDPKLCYNFHGYMHFEPILLGVLTNSDVRYQDTILPLLDLHKYIRFYVISEKESVQKPSHLIFQRAKHKSKQISRYLQYYHQPASPDHPNSTDGSSSGENDTHPCVIHDDDYLHIGDSLAKDILGAVNSSFDHVLLCRDSSHDALLQNILNEQNQKLITGDVTPKISVSQDGYQRIFSRQQQRDDYTTMQMAVQEDIKNNVKLQKSREILESEVITTFRNLLQVRDAYFHDILPLMYAGSPKHTKSPLM